MSEGSNGAQKHYKLSISDRVLEHLSELSDIAERRGDLAAFVSALKEFRRLLVIYPQFGDPLNDLNEYRGQIRIGVIPPLTMRYGVLEEERLVFVTALPVLMAKK
jgi:hypothetical protein